MQQCLPLAVLKPERLLTAITFLNSVATVLTACGIETRSWHVRRRTYQANVATVLTACGIETPPLALAVIVLYMLVATVLTACGIETACL